MDGRDIGTYVLPKANVKVYLTASRACRAKRRYDELAAKGEACDLAAIEADIIERDKRDDVYKRQAIRLIRKSNSKQGGIL